MKGLLLKDFLCLRKQFFMMVAVFVFYAALGLFANNYDFLSSFVPFIFTIMILTSFSFDDACKWSSYALTLPISRHQLVFSKYALSTLLILTGAFYSCLYGYFMLWITKNPITFELLVSSLTATLLCLLLISIQLPFIFRFSVEKARYTTIGIFLLIPLCFLMVIEKTGLLERIDLSAIDITTFFKYFFITGIIVLIVSFSLSISIACRIADKKDY